MLCSSLVVQEIGIGFTLSADKTSNPTPFEATLTISYPTKPNETVSIVWVKPAAIDECIQDVKLDSMGKATVKFQVNKDIEIYCIHGFGCCTFVGPNCTMSNRLSFKVGTDWGGMVLIGAGLLAAAYVLGSIFKGRGEK